MEFWSHGEFSQHPASAIFLHQSQNSITPSLHHSPMNAAQIVQALKEKFADAITGTVEFRGEHSVSVKLELLKPLMRYCRDELGFDYLIDVSSVDHGDVEPR